MISNGEIRVAKSEGLQWHYLAEKKLSALLRGITSKNNLNRIKEHVKIKVFIM